MQRVCLLGHLLRHLPDHGQKVGTSLRASETAAVGCGGACDEISMDIGTHVGAAHQTPATDGHRPVKPARAAGLHKSVIARACMEVWLVTVNANLCGNSAVSYALPLEVFS